MTQALPVKANLNGETQMDEATLSRIFDMTGFDREKIKLVKNIVARDANDMQFAYFLNVAKKVGLDPLTRQIWCLKDFSNKGSGVLVFAGRDGFRHIAQQSGKLKSINSSEVYSSDKFEFGSKNGEMFINHSFSQGTRRKDSEIIGAYCIVKLLDGGEVVEWADYDTYKKPHGVWNTHGAEMIKKVAEVHALKKAFSITGIYAEEEFDIRDGKVRNQVVNEAPSIETAEEIVHRIKACKSEKQLSLLTDNLPRDIQGLDEKGKSEVAGALHVKRSSFETKKERVSVQPIAEDDNTEKNPTLDLLTETDEKASLAADLEDADRESEILDGAERALHDEKTS